MACFDSGRRIPLGTLSTQPNDRSREQAISSLSYGYKPAAPFLQEPREGGKTVDMTFFKTPDRPSQKRRPDSASPQTSTIASAYKRSRPEALPLEVTSPARISPKITITGARDLYKTGCKADLNLSFTSTSILGRGSRCTYRFPRAAKAISRVHAEISWNKNVNKFILKVKGQNGLSLSGIGELRCGAEMELEAKSFQNEDGPVLGFFGYRIEMHWPRQASSCKDTPHSMSTGDPRSYNLLVKDQNPVKMLAEPWLSKTLYSHATSLTDQTSLTSLDLQSDGIVRASPHATPKNWPESSLMETSSVLSRSRSNSFSSVHDAAQEEVIDALCTSRMSKPNQESLSSPASGLSSELSVCDDPRRGQSQDGDDDQCPNIIPSEEWQASSTASSVLFEPPSQNILHGLIIDAMTFSKRPSLTPTAILEGIFSSQPIYRNQDRASWRRLVVDALEQGEWYDRIARGGKDSNGNELPTEYHYNPNRDKDQERAQLYPELARPMREASRRGLEKGIDWRAPKYRRW